MRDYRATTWYYASISKSRLAKRKTKSDKTDAYRRKDEDRRQGC